MTSKRSNTSIRDTPSPPRALALGNLNPSSIQTSSTTSASSLLRHRRSLSASNPPELNLMKTSHLNPGTPLNRASPTTAATSTTTTYTTNTSPTSPASQSTKSPTRVGPTKKIPLAGKGKSSSSKNVPTGVTRQDEETNHPRRVSSSAESLRKHIERAATPSDKSAKPKSMFVSDKPSTPTPSLIRRSSGSSSSVASLSHSQNTTPDSTTSPVTSARNSRIIRAPTPSSPTVQKDIEVAFPSANSPPSVSPSGSTSNLSILSGHSVRSIDFLKSSLRDTLVNGGGASGKGKGKGKADEDNEQESLTNARDRTVSSPPAVERTHKSRRSVSFALEEDVSGAGGQAEMHSVQSDGSSSQPDGIAHQNIQGLPVVTSISEPSSERHPEFTKTSSTTLADQQSSYTSKEPFIPEPIRPGGSVFAYVNNDRPTTRSRRQSQTLHPSPSPPDSSTAVTPLGLVSADRFFTEYVMKVVNDVKSAYLASEQEQTREMSERRAIDRDEDTLSRAGNQQKAVKWTYKERNAISQVAEVVVGLWLAAIWLVIGRVLELSLNTKKKYVRN